MTNSHVYNQRVDRISLALILYCTSMYITVSGIWPTVIGALGIAAVASLYGLGGVFLVTFVYAILRYVYEWFWVDSRYCYTFNDEFPWPASLVALMMGVLLLFAAEHIGPPAAKMVLTNVWQF